MDRLPFTHRDAALDLLKFNRLKLLVEMRQTAPPMALRNRFLLTSEQWTETLDAVILTKLSYFTISLSYPNSYINKLLEIAAYALGKPGMSLAEMYAMTEKDYPYFARWLKSAHDIKLLKYRHAQNLQKKAAAQKTS